jgi:hypothetical protein
MRQVFRWWALLLFLAIVVQIGLAGVGAFRSVKLADKAGLVQKHTLEDFWNPHVALGYVIVLGALVLVVIATIGRRDEVRWSGLLFGLTIVQVLLAWLAGWKGALGFFHPINALLVFGVCGLIVHRTWTGRSTSPAPARAA